MKTVSFRLSESDIELLERLASERGVSKTQYIRDALQGAIPVNTDDVQSRSDAVAALVAQLDRKDEQIARQDEELSSLRSALTDALANAQEIGKAAQLLQAAEKKDVLLSDGESAEPKKTLWQRFADMW